MKFLIAALTILLFSAPAQAQLSRLTSFDDRPLCEENKGVWRQYGDGCVDECQAKLDQFLICTSAITYGCDCGFGRCWDEDKCVALKEYKKKFDAAEAEEKKVLDEEKKKRKAIAQETQDTIMNGLVTKASANAQTYDPNSKTAPQNNYGEFFKQPDPSNSQAAEPQTQIYQANPNAITQVPPTTTQQQQVIEPFANPEVPPFFLEQERRKEEAKKNANAGVAPIQNPAQTISQTPQSNTAPASPNPMSTTTPTQNVSPKLGLPVVPLPN